MANVVSICGSLRKGSYNRMLMQALPGLAPPGMAIMEAPPFRVLEPEELYTASVRDDDGLREEIRKRADTVYHPVGTCRMGAGEDPHAVVDPSLKVRGLDGLFVIDASVMPTLIGGNTNAPTTMIAEKAVDILKAA